MSVQDSNSDLGHGQIRIGENGELESQPLTWDGEPMFSPETVREPLVDGKPFEQIPGQLSIGSAHDAE